MIFRQLFDSVSGTYTYLLASRRGGEALIIDPVLEKVDRYLQLVDELDLKLVKAVDTHLHADHITGLGALRDRTHCITVMGEHSKVDVVSMRLAEGDKLDHRGRRARRALHARPHRRFLQLPDARPRVHRRHAAHPRHRPHRFPERRPARAIRFDLQQAAAGCPTRRWSIPAHDYKGETVSTIGEEKAFNPRLQVKSVDEYVELMNNLNLPNPKMMDVAVPANMRVGLAQEAIARRGWAVTRRARRWRCVGRPDVALVDLREKTEREKHGVIPGSLHAPYPDLAANVASGGMLHELAARHRQAHHVLLRLRRALGHGGAGGAGRRARIRLPHPGRHRCLEKGERAAPALAETKSLCAYAGDASAQNLAEEQLGALVLRMAEEGLGLVHLDDLAGVHQHHAVRDLARKAHLVAHHQHGHAVEREADHGVEHLLDHLRIERGGRLVEQHDLRLHAQRARDRDPLLLAAGELSRIFVRLLRDAHALEIVPARSPRPPASAACGTQIGRERAVLAARSDAETG